ncbi:unnamed protein product, partial [Amoebophrya sp. A120]
TATASATRRPDFVCEAEAERLLELASMIQRIFVATTKHKPNYGTTSTLTSSSSSPSSRVDNDKNAGKKIKRDQDHLRPHAQFVPAAVDEICAKEYTTRAETEIVKDLWKCVPRGVAELQIQALCLTKDRLGSLWADQVFHAALQDVFRWLRIHSNWHDLLFADFQRLHVVVRGDKEQGPGRTSA